MTARPWQRLVCDVEGCLLQIVYEFRLHGEAGVLDFQRLAVVAHRLFYRFGLQILGQPCHQACRTRRQPAVEKGGAGFAAEID